MQLKALLLDLDGTLVDTAPDMVATLNRILVQRDQAPVPFEPASKLVSNGAGALLDHGFSQPLADELRQELIQSFLTDYADHVCVESALYDGMQDCLELCKQSGIPWGVVTNKPLELSRSLLDGLGLLNECRILLGGDSLPVKKPDPAPLLHCCFTLNLAASECLYVGDHERDIQAGNAAGMDTAAAQWGYLHNPEVTLDWRAKYVLRRPQGLLTLMQERLAEASFGHAR